MKLLRLLTELNGIGLWGNVTEEEEVVLFEDLSAAKLGVD